MDTYHVELAGFRTGGWFALLSSIACAGATTYFGEYKWAWGFALVGLLGLYFLLGVGHYDFDPRGMTCESAFGTWRILWDEIIRVEMGTDGTNIFYGDNKQFVLPHPNQWARSSRDEAVAFVNGQLSARQLAATESAHSAAYKTMKNTRIKRHI